MNPIFAITFAWIITGCGIEVGNPKPDSTTSTGGTLKVRMESGESSNQSLTMNIASLNLYGGSNESDSYEVEPLKSSIDLLSQEFTRESGAIIAEFSNIANAFYSRMTITLAAENGLNFVDAKGEEAEIALDDDSDGIIEFATDVEVTDDGEEELVAIFDPEKSIFAPEASETKYRFRPLGEAHHARPGLQFVAQTDVANATYACAYLIRNLPPPEMRHGRRHSGRELDNMIDFAQLHGDDDRHTKVKPRPSFADEGVSRSKDSNSSCDNAFARVKVVEGEYEFLRLRPGIYDFRVFAKDGDAESFVDHAQGILIEPQRRK